MTKFSIINLIIFIIALLLSNNLISEETILPKPQPNIEELQKKEIILPKSQSKNEELQKQEILAAESKSNKDVTLKEESVLPKSKPLISKELILQTKQKKIFVEQIALSKDLDLPIVIHNRNSNDDLIDILVKQKPKGVVHCFSGDISLAQKLIDLGLYLSFTGIITFKNSNLSDVIKRIDINQIMIETDSPYLTPEPHRGKRNEPSYVKIIAEKIAEIRNMNIENVISTTTKNAFRLFQRIK